MTVLDILVAARAIVASRKRWTKCTLARNASRRMVPPNSPDAVCWCGYGAVMLVSDSNTTRQDALEVLYEAAGSNFPEFQDNATHQEMLDCFDRAIFAAPRGIEACIRSASGGRWRAGGQSPRRSC